MQTKRIGPPFMQIDQICRASSVPTTFRFICRTQVTYYTAQICACVHRNLFSIGTERVYATSNQKQAANVHAKSTLPSFINSNKTEMGRVYRLFTVDVIQIIMTPTPLRSLLEASVSEHSYSDGVYHRTTFTELSYYSKLNETLNIYS